MPEPSEFQLNFKEKSLTGIEQHVSIFQDISKEEGFDSTYHYTLVLKDNKLEEKYKLHVFYIELKNQHLIQELKKKKAEQKEKRKKKKRKKKKEKTKDNGGKKILLIKYKDNR